MVRNAQDVIMYFVWQHADHAPHAGHEGCVIWFTILPGLTPGKL
jgi:hypothetical protein